VVDDVTAVINVGGAVAATAMIDGGAVVVVTVTAMIDGVAVVSAIPPHHVGQNAQYGLTRPSWAWDE
jgi:hypothetical protein